MQFLDRPHALTIRVEALCSQLNGIELYYCPRISALRMRLLLDQGISLLRS